MKILVIGDSCQDVFIYGKCDRLCPDAPVPVFIPFNKKKNGGMALNVYENLKSLDVDVDILTNKEKVTKTRYVDITSNQILLRVDSEKKELNRVKNLDSLNFDNYDAVIISDYNKGFLNYEDIEFICNSHDNVFIDTKKIINKSFINCKFLKINEHEYKFNTSHGGGLLDLNDKLIVTLGSRGCKYQDKIFEVEKVEIRDMCGAGDTFISSLVYKYVLTNNIKQSIRFANECSTIIVQHKGVNRIGNLIKNK
jgi:D-beta-D-heptose 7-phosphate kinase/D-beta-D-heptose 1-phosphate adenosyltransferase